MTENKKAREADAKLLPLKAISIQQPWAGLIVGNIKDIENRTWSLHHPPGRLAIHAGKTYDIDADPEVRDILTRHYGWSHESVDKLLDWCRGTTGAIVGYCQFDLIAPPDTTTHDKIRKRSRWANQGMQLWCASHPFYLKKPIPCRGALQLFNWRKNLI